jgi:hypothetical protein
MLARYDPLWLIPVIVGSAAIRGNAPFYGAGAPLYDTRDDA